MEIYLLKQDASNQQMQWGGFFELAEAYAQLGRKADAKELLNKLKASYIDQFNALISIYEEYYPDVGRTFQ